MRLLLLTTVLLLSYFQSPAESVADFKQLSRIEISDNMRYSAIDTLSVDQSSFTVHLVRKVAYIRKPVFCQLPIQGRRKRDYDTVA